MDAEFWEGGVTLLPFDESTEELAVRAREDIRQELELSDRFDEELNRLHESKFNPHNLFTAVRHTQRCDPAGEPDPSGEFYRGIVLTMSSSVEEACDVVTIESAQGTGGFVIDFGEWKGGHTQGLIVNSQDAYNLNRIEKPVLGALKSLGCSCRTVVISERETILYASTAASTVKAAIETAKGMATAYLSRLGLEASVYNLIRQRKNVIEITEENLARWVHMPEDPSDTYPDVVIIVTTRVCRRCRAEWQELFVEGTRNRPDIHFGITFGDKPKRRFTRKVFEEDCGGVASTGKVMPFLIFYRQGVFQSYIATTREEPPPSPVDLSAGIGKYLGH